MIVIIDVKESEPKKTIGRAHYFFSFGKSLSLALLHGRLVLCESIGTGSFKQNATHT
jgi:hypothetical protein